MAWSVPQSGTINVILGIDTGRKSDIMHYCTEVDQDGTDDTGMDEEDGTLRQDHK